MSRTRARGGLGGFVLAFAAAMSLAGCGVASAAQGLSSIPAAPVVVADQTKLDEQAGLTITLAYTAAARLASLAIRTGIVSDPATLRAIGAANVRSKAAVDAVRLAYQSANSASYLAALKEARAAITALLTSVKG